MDFIYQFAPPLIWPIKFSLFVSAATYIASIISSNVSQVDRLWTFLPTIYTAYFALSPIWPRSPANDNSALSWVLPYVPKDASKTATEEYHPRALLMLGLVVVWMFRLSYNTYRRGLFSLKDEDYRWAVLRSQLSPVLFQLTNLVFISFIQNIILLLLGIPTYYVISDLNPAHRSLNLGDVFLAGAATIVLILEFISDNQQFAFHAYKHSVLKAKDGAAKYDESQQWPGARLNFTERDVKRGFLTKGLWAYARHPNFACEQSFWWIITLFPIVAQGQQEFSIEVLVQLLPAIVLSTLFLSSTAYTESITSPKYPEYKKYQKRVAMFGPFGITGYRGLRKWKEED